MCRSIPDFASEYLNASGRLSSAAASAAMNGTADYDDGFQFDDYELDGSQFDLNWMIKFVPSVIIYSLTFVTGFIGNILVIFAIMYLKKLQSVTNLFLLSLATADLLLIIICVPIKITEFFSNSWLFGNFGCKLFHYMQFFTAICSVMNLTTMSLAKYTCTRRRAKLIIGFIWILSCVAATPILMGQEIIKLGMNKDTDVCFRIWCPIEWMLFEIYRTTIVLVVPLSIMSVAYSCICMELWKMPSVRRHLSESIKLNANPDAKKSAGNGGAAGLDKITAVSRTSSINIQANRCDSVQDETLVVPLRGAENNNAENASAAADSAPMLVAIATTRAKRLSTSNARTIDDDYTRKQIIKMLLCIIAIFFISWAPLTINNLLTSFQLLPNVNTGFFWYLRITFFAMSYVNSCINPIVYAFMSKNFRDGFKRIISKLCSYKKERGVRSDMTSIRRPSSREKRTKTTTGSSLLKSISSLSSLKAAKRKSTLTTACTIQTMTCNIGNQ